MLAKTLSVGVLQPRKFAAPAQKAFRTHKGFNVDAELEGQLVKIRTEMEGTSELKKPQHKLNQLGRLPHPGVSVAKDSNTSISDVTSEANKTQGGFEVVFVNPRLSQEHHGMNSMDVRNSNLGMKKRAVYKEMPATDRFADRPRESYPTTKLAPEPNVEAHPTTDGFVMELTGLDECIIKVTWEDFTPLQEREDEESRQSDGEEDSDKLLGSEVDGKSPIIPEAAIHPKKKSGKTDEGDTMQTACSNTAISDLILEDLISLRKGQTLKKEYSFEALGAHRRRGVKFVLSLLAGDGSCTSSRIDPHLGSGEIEDPTTQDEDFLMRNTIADKVKYRFTRCFAHSA
jgi:hypothetical protein